jgi:hypothetical protein
MSHPAKRGSAYRSSPWLAIPAPRSRKLGIGERHKVHGKNACARGSSTKVHIEEHRVMAKDPSFDVAAAHKYFAAQCFNQAWDLIEKKDRTPEDERMMVALNQASIYHWLQRDDRNDQRLSVGYWQASRIQAILGSAPEALRYAEVCLAHSGALPPFFLGYAHEALARAHELGGDPRSAREHLDAALELAARVGEEDDRELLLADLHGVSGSP